MAELEVANMSSPVEVDVEIIEQRAKEIGKTNLQWNNYQSALDVYNKFKDAGLTPMFLCDMDTGVFGIITREQLDNKLH